FGDPVRLTIAEVADLLEVAHEAGELCVIRPEGEDLFDGRMNVDGFIELDDARSVANTGYVAEVVIGDGASEQGESGESAGKAQGTVIAEAVKEKGASDTSGGQAQRGRPVLLHELGMALARHAALEAGDATRVGAGVETVLHLLNAGNGPRAAEQAIELVFEDGAGENNPAVL